MQVENPRHIRGFERGVHPTDSYSNKTMLPASTPGEVAKLAQLSREIQPEPPAKEKQAAPPRSLRRRLSPQAIDELIARYTAGEKTPALSREFGISESGLRDLLRAEGVPLRGHAITPEDAEQAVQLYARGLTITEAVAQIGYSHGTIRTVLLKHGVAIRSGVPRKRVVPSK
jgi:AraC-like DNA-binding protein